MKPIALIVSIAALLITMVLTTPAVSLAQDVAKVAPNNVKVLLENDHVRVLDIRIKPGEKLAMHSHPAYVIYSLTSGKTKSTSPDGKTEELDIKAGEARWNDGQTHISENSGTTEAHVVLVEMKGSPTK
ncbi:MAG: cytoplasmic protein [Candidatus Binatia bacterium]